MREVYNDIPIVMNILTYNAIVFFAILLLLDDIFCLSRILYLYIIIGLVPSYKIVYSLW